MSQSPASATSDKTSSHPKPNGLAAMNACLASLQIHRCSSREARFLLFLRRKAQAGRDRILLKWVALELGEEDDSFYHTRRISDELKGRGLVMLSQQKEATGGERRRNARTAKVWLTRKGKAEVEAMGRTVELDAKEILRTETRKKTTKPKSTS